MPPLQQELLGFHLAATAAAEAASRGTWQGRAVFALDCKAALRTPTSAVARDKYPGLASEIRAALTRASAVGMQLSFAWAPSHGKRPAWEAAAGMCSELLRLLNDKAVFPRSHGSRRNAEAAAAQAKRRVGNSGNSTSCRAKKANPIQPKRVRRKR